MNAWYLLALPAWLIVLATATARLGDMTRAQWQPIHHIRRLGLILCAVAAVSMLVTPFAEDGWLYGESNWRGVIMAWAWALVWLTTPGMPPWYDFILGVHRSTDEWRSHGPRARINGELRALADSFFPRYRRRRNASSGRPVDPE